MDNSITNLLFMFLLVLQGVTFTRSEAEIEPHKNINPLNNLILNDNAEENTSQNSDPDHVRIKRQFGYYPYGYYPYPRPLPIIVGGIGIGRPGFGFGGFGFGRPGFGGRGFGSRGFGGRGFGGRGFGGRGFGGFGGRGFGGFGGRGGRG